MPINRIENGVSPTTSTYKLHTILETANVNPFSYEDTYISPPIGKLWKILNMFLYCRNPLGATFGEHTYVIKSGTINIVMGESVFGSNLLWDYCGWEIANSSQKPGASIDAQYALNNIYLTNDNKLTIKYINNTDATQVEARDIRVSVKETTLI